MKILCLIVILANVFVFMWEYRNGAFNTNKANLGQQLIQGKEQIILLREVKIASTPALPASHKQAD